MMAFGHTFHTMLSPALTLLSAIIYQLDQPRSSTHLAASQSIPFDRRTIGRHFGVADVIYPLEPRASASGIDVTKTVKNVDLHRTVKKKTHKTNKREGGSTTANELLIEEIITCQ